MKQNKWEQRDRERHKKKNGMRIDGSSTKLLWNIAGEKARKSRKEKEDKADE